MKKLLLFLALAAAGLQGWADDLYVVGRATPIGWKSSGRAITKMTETETKKFVWSGLLEANKNNDDGFKICKGDDTWGAYTATSKGKDITSGTEYDIQESSDDFKWDITETGYYTVTINLSTRKLTVTKNQTASFGIHRMESNPYSIEYLEIGSADALSDFAYLVNNGTNSTSFNANLTADITLNGSHTPIGTSSKKYSGTFDGKEHKIINLSITENGNSKGFFGETSGATIKDVEFLKANINITSGQNTGVVVGVCDNTKIQRCAVVNSYLSGNDHTGSIAGCAKGNSIIQNCYSNAKVVSVNQAAGMVGTSEGMTIEHCLFMGPRIESSGGYGARGLISLLEGSDDNQTHMKNNLVAAQYVLSNGNRHGVLTYIDYGTLYPENNYSLSTTLYGPASNPATESHTNKDDINGAQVAPNNVNQDFFSTTLGFDLIDTWKMVEDLTYAGGSYPILKWMSIPASVEISTSKELTDFSTFMWDNQNATLTQDIVADENYAPMGNEFRYYYGTFDGQGHDVTLALTGNKFQGLFGCAKDNAVFRNIVIKGSVSGTGNCAALVGEVKGNHGTITISRVGLEAAVTGTGSCIGAFVGNNWGGTVKLEVKNCFNIGNIVGDSNTSILGWYTKGTSTFENVYNTGTLSEGGKFINFMSGSGTFTNCFTTTTESEIEGLSSSYPSDKVTSGELCYQLNSDQSEINWYQTLAGTDDRPYLFDTHKQVYQISESSYTNIPVTTSGKVQISNADELLTFAKEVNAGNVSMNAELTGNIDYSASAYQGQDAMIGTGPNPYKGTFDGQNHTITVEFNNTNAEYTGLFCQVNGATIKNLKVAGNITTDKKFAGGICANVNRNATITNCESNVTITDSRTTEVDGTHGGIVALISSHGDGVEISNCLFSGAITASKADGCGGVVGWTSGGSSNVTIKNCLITGTMTVRTNGANDIIARNGANESNNYFVGSFTNISNDEKAVQKTVDQETSGELCYLLNGSTQGGTNWTQTIGTDNYPVPFNTQKLVYFNDPDYANMHIVNNVYQIATANELVDFSALVNDVNASLDAELTADIDMSSVTGWTPIGQHLKDYAGHFNGQGHRIKNLTTSSGYNNQALFGQAIGPAIIENIIIDKSCTIQGKQWAAGILGHVWGDDVIIRNCGNEANVTGDGDGDTCAGILGCSDGKVVHISNCYNTGTISGQKWNAGICGWMGNANSTIENCYSIGTVSGSDTAPIWRYVDNSLNEGNATNNWTASDGQGSKITGTMLTDGELCYKLGAAFTQDLSQTSYPTFGSKTVTAGKS